MDGLAIGRTTTGFTLGEDLVDLLFEEDRQRRGYSFEDWLYKLFSWSGLYPRRPFRNVGEQIDGSIKHGEQIYIVEAKFREKPAQLKDLLTLHGKVEGKAAWTKGVFISITGFTEDALRQYSNGRRANLVCLDKNDLVGVLECKVGLRELIQEKIRWAGESNEPFRPVQKLFPERFAPKKRVPKKGFKPKLGTSKLKLATAADALKADPLRDFHVFWRRTTTREVEKFVEIVRCGVEKRIREYVVQHRNVLIEPLRGGHGRYVMLGSELQVPPDIDFLIGERSSIGCEWYVIELKSPHALPVDAQGNPTPVLESTLRKIRRWRRWLKKEIDFARRERTHSGLGLTDIVINTPALVLIGNRGVELSARQRNALNKLKDDGVVVHTYDWLIENQPYVDDPLRSFVQPQSKVDLTERIPTSRATSLERRPRAKRVQINKRPSKKI